MDALNSPTDPVRAKIAQAQAKINRLKTLAWMHKDPIAVMYDVTSDTLEAQLEWHDGMRAMVDSLQEKIDQRAAKSVDATSMKLVGQLTPEVARLSRQWNHKLALRSIIWSTAALLALFGFEGAVAYGMGYSSGHTAGVNAGAVLSGAIKEGGAREEAVLAKLLQYNDLGQVMALCDKSPGEQDGRRTCMAPIWLDPPSPPSS